MMKYLFSFALMITASSTAIARMNGEEVMQDLRAARDDLTQPIIAGANWAPNATYGGDEAEAKMKAFSERKAK